MSDNDVASDMAKCQKLAKEMASIENLTNKYKKYKKILSDIEATRKLLEKESQA